MISATDGRQHLRIAPILSMPDEAGGRPARPSRSRPCDTCRLRKTRCVKEAAQSQCVLCAFHGQRCTFLRGPLPRQRHRQPFPRGQPPPQQQSLAVLGGNDDDIDVDGESEPSTSRTSSGNRLGGYDDIDNGGGALSPPKYALPRAGSSVDASLADVSSFASPAKSRRRPSESDHDVADDDDDWRISPPAILNDTLGLDPTTHAEYVGPTDYRDPILLDLHRPPPPSSSDTPPDPAPSELARRLDDQTIFIVRPDEAAASEAQRIADLDAIEATVHPHGPTLVDLYFRIVHPSFPILHKHVFVSKHRLSHRHFAPSLLAAVYLVALDWRLYDSVLAGRQAEAMPDAVALERLAERTVSQDMRRPKLSTVEAGLLLLQRHRRVTEPAGVATSGRAFAAQMVAMAQDLGLHLDCSSWSIPVWEVGLRRRLAWALYMQDRWGALVHGRPFFLHDDDWDVRPCADSDFPELDPGQSRDAAVDVDVRMGWEIFVRHIELAHMLTEVVSVFYSPKATRVGGTLDRVGVTGALELAQPFVLHLREWSSALPDTLRLENKPRGKLCANGSLHLAHVSIEIAIHRALVRTLTPHTTEALRSAVRSAAQVNLRAATELLTSLEPEHTAAFWGRAAAHQVAHVGSLAALLWATAETTDEMAWCAARVGELRWALRVRGQAAPFAREALRLLEHDIGGFGVVRDGPETLLR
ncbi:fungal specific transcription factor [Hirsutella rhossiliensis]|uniref:Fungal specific transcription factor domain-containing protein n=1 Tax=Hirsutella rhossiliensis TaxID=111463 RepID=A0A9P8MQF0_9HYPO|nr:fungal specific transcription factor domain-containing protein [Hirsutella rhossiliensis]KAH0959537.1 fungal specific transcription factor domain-containing protein [Hirsutella rhossiliensis]